MPTGPASQTGARGWCAGTKFLKGKKGGLGGGACKGIKDKILGQVRRETVQVGQRGMAPARTSRPKRNR